MPSRYLAREAGTVFDQVSNPDKAIKKTRKEWVVEGVLIGTLVVIVLGIFFYALY